MNDINQHAIKQRIFDTAVMLFARKSYGTVGVREIAAEADVSISMVSYHFGGKVGILKAVISKYFSLFEAMFKQAVRDNDSFEVNVRRFFKGSVDLIRREHDLSLVWISEMNNEIPELTELKAHNQRQVANDANRLLSQVGLDFSRDKEIISIIGPALIQMIFSHFMSGAMLEYDGAVEFNDAYFERYAETLAAMCLTGVRGAFPVKSSTD